VGLRTDLDVAAEISKSLALPGIELRSSILVTVLTEPPWLSVKSPMNSVSTQF